jgi:hypothetical protein
MMMIIDEFSAHMTAGFRTAIADCGTHLEFVTGGYTSHHQVMDVGLNKPFKNHYRDAYDNWFMIAPHGEKPSRQNVACWVENHWAEIENSVMTNSWRRMVCRNLPVAMLKQKKWTPSH